MRNNALFILFSLLLVTACDDGTQEIPPSCPLVIDSSEYFPDANFDVNPSCPYDISKKIKIENKKELNYYGTYRIPSEDIYPNLDLLIINILGFTCEGKAKERFIISTRVNKELTGIKDLKASNAFIKLFMPFSQESYIMDKSKDQTLEIIQFDPAKKIFKAKLSLFLQDEKDATKKLPFVIRDFSLSHCTYIYPEGEVFK